MKKISKKLLSFLLAFGMILSMFAVNSATIQAADEHVPASATLVAYPKPATESLAWQLRLPMQDHVHLPPGL